MDSLLTAVGRHAALYTFLTGQIAFPAINRHWQLKKKKNRFWSTIAVYYVHFFHSQSRRSLTRRFANFSVKASELLVVSPKFVKGKDAKM
jgi:hypothetical protein